MNEKYGFDIGKTMSWGEAIRKAEVLRHARSHDWIEQGRPSFSNTIHGAFFSAL